MTDLVSDITTLATISYSLKPPTERFPLGYGKVESLGALGVSGLLLTGGIMIGLQALMALTQQFFPEFAEILASLGVFAHIHDHGHSHSHDMGPSIHAAWLAAGSIAVKEWLYRSTIKIARQKRSSVLASNAYHHRVDSLTSFVALLTIVASNFLANAQWLDPIGGLAISGMIVQAGWGNTKAALLELADVAMDEEVRSSVDKAARQVLEAQVGPEAELRGVQGVKSGQNFLVELEVAVPEDLPLDRAQEYEAAIREKVSQKIRGVRRVSVRFTNNAKKDAFVDEFVAGRLSDGEDDGHDHDDHGHEHAQANGKVGPEKRL